jgi:hypothetical protein
MGGDQGRRRRGRGAAAASVIAAIALVAFGSTPARSEGDVHDGACRISGGYGAVLADQALPDGTFGYRGVIILFTKSCGDGPKGVSGTFRPVVGSPATCTPIAAPRIDQAACSFVGSLGVGLAGTPVVVNASAYTSGVIDEHLHDRDTVKEASDARVQPGAEQLASECVLLLPEDGGRIACSLF